MRTDGMTDQQMDSQTDGHDEAKSRFPQFSESD